METVKLPIYSAEGKQVESIQIKEGVFGLEANKDALHQAVVGYLSNQRKGTASTKTRGEVSGGGKKPWKQKGTGRARVGSTRSPLWRHGGAIFGPHPRDFSYPIPDKIKKLALKSSLYIKLKEDNLIIIEDFTVATPKTKEAVKVFNNLKVDALKNVLILLDKCDNNLKLALRNIDFLTVNLAKDTHAYEILANQKIILTKTAFDILTERLKAKKLKG